MSDVLPTPCPANWEYEDRPNYNTRLTARKTALLKQLRRLLNSQKAAVAADTRIVHGLMFKGLTPEDFDYFAGHYRGEQFRCLMNYEVGIQGDKRVGHPAATIPMEMNAFTLSVGQVVHQLDYHYSVPNAIFSPAHKLLRAIELAAAVFVYFLEIHPYANGNGHMARWILMALLGRHDIYLNASFDLHPRPTEPLYSNAIVQYRNNNKAPLHILLMECL